MLFLEKLHSLKQNAGCKDNTRAFKGRCRLLFLITKEGKNGSLKGQLIRAANGDAQICPINLNLQKQQPENCVPLWLGHALCYGV